MGRPPELVLARRCRATAAPRSASFGSASRSRRRGSDELSNTPEKGKESTMSPFTRTATLLLAVTGSPALGCPDATSSGFPIIGRLSLSGSYNIDPFKVSVLGGGASALRDCGLEAEGLTGYEGDGIIDVRPDVVLDWLGGGERLVFTVENEADTLLVIRDPGGRWHFDDNSREHNPLIVLNEPETGEYVVFVGNHGTPPTSGPPGELIITETAP
jgi:hypothetical protein